MSHHRDILTALERLRSGVSTLTSEQYVAVLEAVEQAAHALHMAPRGHDPVATGIWWRHERAPALARLADSLTHRPVSDDYAERPNEPSDVEIVKALQDSLLERQRR